MINLSIISINLNNCAGLSKTLSSIFCQDFNSYEIIVIDGGSQDNSVELLKIHSNKISFWISEPDNGIYNAMNKGILKARGKYCLFLNSGDYLVSEDVLSQAFSRGKDEDIIYGDLLIDGIRRNYPEKLSPLFFFKTSLGHPSTIIKRDLFERYGLYSENYQIISDWEFFTRAIIIHHCSYLHLNLVVSYFSSDGISSRNTDLLTKEHHLLLKQLFPTVYDDYLEHIEMEREIAKYESSKLARFCINLIITIIGLYPRLSTYLKKAIHKCFSNSNK